MPLFSPNSHPNSLSSLAVVVFSSVKSEVLRKRAKNTSRKAWQDGDGFVATAVALLFPLGEIWQERVKCHLFAGLEEMPVRVFWRRNSRRSEGNGCGISCQGCRWCCLCPCRRQPGPGLLRAPRGNAHGEENSVRTNPSVLSSSAPLLLQRMNHCMAWAGFERPGCLPWVGISVPRPGCSIQPSLERFQGWGMHSFSGQPVPVVENFFLISNLSLASCC